MLACVDQSASLPSSAVERSAAFPGLVGVTGFEPATPTSRKMSREFENPYLISGFRRNSIGINWLLYHQMRRRTLRPSRFAPLLSPP